MFFIDQLGIIMNNKQKFETFLESLKGNGQDTLIESVKKGFQVCMEGTSAVIKIIPEEEWPEGKSDPTQYDHARKEIQVRSDYNQTEDPYAWMVHERMHAKLDESGELDDNKTYPLNRIEQLAYVEQFKELINRGKSIEDVKKMMPLKFENYEDTMNKYWKMALKNN